MWLEWLKNYGKDKFESKPKKIEEETANTEKACRCRE
jgi:hypothetical protein